jgi:hypothetical protein
LAEFMGDEQDLAVAIAPLAGGVNKKKAHRVILAQRNAEGQSPADPLSDPSYLI